MSEATTEQIVHHSLLTPNVRLVILLQRTTSSSLFILLRHAEVMLTHNLRWRLCAHRCSDIMRGGRYTRVVEQ